MSNSSSISIPTWALPLIVSLFVGAISYGAATANAQATANEVKRVEKIVEKVQESTTDNSKKTALNEQMIQQIADGLSQQVEISKATDAKLSRLIDIMIENRQ